MSVEEKTIDLSIARSRYLEAGRGEPLLMLHGVGIGNSANSFDPILPALAERYHVYALDMLGFGLGDRQLEQAPTFDLLVDHVREFMDVVGLERTRLVGHSLGGWISGLLAYQSPQRIERLVMLCAAGLNAEPFSGIHPPQLPTGEQIEARLRGMSLHPDRLDPDLVAGYVQAQLRCLAVPGAQHSLDTAFAQMENPAIRSRYLLQRRLPFIKVPTLVAWGEADTMDPYPTWTSEWPQLQGDMARSVKPWVIPGARYVLLPTGHVPQVEDPQGTIELLLEFLERA